MRLWSWSLPPEARWIGSPAHCCRPLQQDEMTCQKRMAANKRMKPTCQTSVLLLPGFVLLVFGFTGGVTAKHAGGLCAVR
jgi:hypothetical protein